MNLFLRQLTLQDNQIGQEGADAFVQNFEDNFTLQELSLSSNRFGKKAKVSLYERFQGDKAQFDVGLAFRGGDEAFGGTISDQYRELRVRSKLEREQKEKAIAYGANVKNKMLKAQSAGGGATALGKAEAKKADPKKWAEGTSTFDKLSTTALGGRRLK